VTIRSPLALIATDVTHPVWPFRESTSLPVRASHTFAVLSFAPVTIHLPSALIAADRHSPESPSRAPDSFPVVASQIFTVEIPSSFGTTRLPGCVTTRLPSALIAPDAPLNE